MSMPPPPIPLAPHTAWMTPGEVDGYRVAGAAPPPPIPLVSPARQAIQDAIAAERAKRVAVASLPPPPIPLAHSCTWCAPGETGPCVCRPPLPDRAPMTPAQEAVHEARVVASIPTFEARHGLQPPPPPPIPLVTLPPPPPPIPLGRPVLLMDTECYKDYWSIGFMDAATEQVVADFESYPGHPLDCAGVARMMLAGTIVSFNGKKYDDPMITLAISGVDNAYLKYASDAIIKTNLQPWLFEKQFNVEIPKQWDTVDMIEVMPGRYNLKMYGGKMHSRRMQDLPIEPDASITPELRPLMRDYRNNDLRVTRDAWFQFKPQIDLRGEMKQQYGVELRSKSDAQIAEAVIKSELGFFVEKPNIPIGTIIRYKTPDFIRFHTPQLQAALAMVQAAEFYISEKFALTMPKEVAAALIPIGQAAYQFGIGGLHSTEAHVAHKADDTYSIKDHDVASYYPSIILRCNLYPQQMGEAFLQVYRKIVKTRLEAKDAAKRAKKAGDKTAAAKHQVTADALKIVVNGSFGKFGSRHSILYAPDLMLQTTITGQLCLLMLIEEMEMSGIQIIQGNTDGVVIKCRRDMEWLKDEIIAGWEKRTGFETEMTEYTGIYSKSVNSYIALKPDGSAKRKGDFAEPIPVGGSWPSPTNDICADAATEYLRSGVPVERTIRACTDVRKFVTVQGVTGGGVKYWGREVQAATTIKGKREQLLAAGWEEAFEPKFFTYGASAQMHMDEAYVQAVQQLRAAAPVRKEYLGKAVRWYYAVDEIGAIHYKTSGNLVPRSEGCRPMMELTDRIPDDLDWDWYINEANAHLRNMGVNT